MVNVTALTEAIGKNPIYSLYGVLRLDALASAVQEKYSKRHRRPPVAWKTLTFFLMLMYLFDVRSERQLEPWLNRKPTLLMCFGLAKAPDHSTFSRFRKRLGKTLFAQLFDHLVGLCQSLGILAKRLVGQDSTDYKAYANRFKKTDAEAAFGHKTGSDDLVYGFKAHIVTDLDSDLPVAVVTRPANEHDSTVFDAAMQPLLHETVQQIEKFVADSGYDASEIRLTLCGHNVTPCIAVNGRGHYPSTPPKDPDYKKRPGCERVNSRAKEYFRLDDLKLRGLANASIHAALSLGAVLLNAVAAVLLKMPAAVHSPLAVRAAID